MSQLQPSQLYPNGSQKCQHSRFNSYDQSVQAASTRYPTPSALPSKRCVSSISAIDPRQLSMFLNEIPANVSDYRFRAIQDGDDKKPEESIYTEPTLVDHNQHDQPNVDAINSLIVPTRPSQATTTTISEWKAPPEAVANFDSNGITPTEPRLPNSPQLTITGQDLAITLNSNSGQMTQTVLSNDQPPSGPTPASSSSVPMNAYLLSYYSSRRVEFLPLCDLLFNIISLVAYFCDVVFASVTAYTFYLNAHYRYFAIVLILILLAAIVSQVLSYRWYIKERKFERKYIHPQMAKGYVPVTSQPSTSTLKLIHIFFCGVLWRYFKLLMPVNLVSVKKEVRDLCVLRMIHAFCQAAPMSLLQLYLIWRRLSPNSITDLNIISIFLSLFSVCWALSSFSKNIRHSHVHKLVLTWLGVIFQFLWRAGTVTSRVVSLSIYATVYTYWLFAVLFLHWFSMILWLVSQSLMATNPTNPSDVKKTTFRACFTRSAILAFVYIFCFINMDDDNPRYKMMAYYTTMFLENILLLSISLFFDTRVILWYRKLSFFLVIGGFLVGMFFMWLYYRFFHIRHLNQSLANVEAAGAAPTGQAHNRTNCANEAHFGNGNENHSLANTATNQQPGKSPFDRLINSVLGDSTREEAANNENVNGAGQERHRLPYPNGNVSSGVFNCSLNPALKRKKKKPSTVPPPPRTTSQHQLNVNEDVLNSFEPTATQFIDGQAQSSANTFWRKSNLSGRNQAVSQPSLGQPENVFRLPSKHPFSATLIAPSSPLDCAFASSGGGDNIQYNNDANIQRLWPNMRLKDTKMVTTAHAKKDNEVDKSLVQYYCHPESKKMMARSQTPEVLLVPQSDNTNSCVFYNYPSSVISVQSNGVRHNATAVNHNNNNNNNFDLNLNDFLSYAKGQDQFREAKDENDVDDATFMSRFQRPPVPGREGDDEGKKKESDYNNASYVEGKRSLVNYSVDKVRMEKLLEKKTLDKGANKSSSTIKSNRSKKKILTKKRCKNRQSQQSMDSIGSTTTSSVSKRNSSSGEEGDIESDINHSADSDKLKLGGGGGGVGVGVESTKPVNLYDQVHRDEDEELGTPVDYVVVGNEPASQLFSSKSSGMLPISSMPTNGFQTRAQQQQHQQQQHQPKIMPASVHQYKTAIDNAAATFISNYHLGSSRISSSAGNQLMPRHHRTLYHSAKYKRHNTPL